MFKRRTLFVLGAGASAEAGLPVGAQLANTISEKLDIRFDRDHIGNGDLALFDQFQRSFPSEVNSYLHAAWLIRDGVVLSRPIDDFLDIHQNNGKVNLYGKAAIAKIILEAERNSVLYFDRTTEEATVNLNAISDTWFVKLMRMLGRSDVGKIFDNVSFIVFNYDRCLEHFLVHALQRLYGIHESDAQSICKGLTIIHPYGSVGELPAAGSLGVPFGASGNGKIIDVAGDIHTYTEQAVDPDTRSAIEHEIVSAECIVFLGFAYHVQNMDMLGLRKPSNDLFPVFCTAHGMSEHDITVVTRQIEGMFNSKHVPRFRSGSSAPLESPVMIKDLRCTQLFDYFAKSLSGG